METMSVSPGNGFEIRVDVWEARNSLWVYSPSIWDAKRNHCLFLFEDKNWSADSSVWEDDATVRLCLRKFPGNHRPDSIRLEVDCLGLTAKLISFATTLDLCELESALNGALEFEK